jgi:hypothetical protein
MISSARGAVETVDVSIAPAASSYSDVFNIPAFDSSLGTLQSISVKARGTGSFTQLVENTGASPETAVVAQSLQLVLNLPGQATPILALRQSEDHEYRLGAFDQELDFNGDSGATHSYPVTASGEVTLRSPNDLARFTGSSLLGIDLVATGALDRFVAGGNGVLEARLTAGLDLTVQFDYFAVPEPIAWSSASLVVLAAALLVTISSEKQLARSFISPEN